MCAREKGREKNGEVAFFSRSLFAAFRTLTLLAQPSTKCALSGITFEASLFGFKVFLKENIPTHSRGKNNAKRSLAVSLLLSLDG